MPNGNGGMYVTRINGVHVYLETYLATAKALHAVVPKAAFGPSNFAAVSRGNCSVCPYIQQFADTIKTANAPLNFVAASEYSRWDSTGLAKPALMTDAPAILGNDAKRATGISTTPTEVHEFGWAGWGKWAPEFGDVSWPQGAYGGTWQLAAFLYLRRAGTSRVLHWAWAVTDSGIQRGNKGRGGNASGYDTNPAPGGR